MIWPSEIIVPKKIKIKNINKKIDKIKLNKNLINFIRWFAMYNMTSLGLVLKMTIGSNNNFFKKDDQNFNQNLNIIKKYNLNKEQTNALNFLNLKNNKFDVSVLQGTTGSGKTIVYFERIKNYIRKNKL